MRLRYLVAAVDRIDSEGGKKYRKRVGMCDDVQAREKKCTGESADLLGWL